LTGGNKLITTSLIRRQKPAPAQERCYKGRCNMNNPMYCPFFIDYVRECSFQIGTICNEFDTIVKFCTSRKNSNCPFFKYLNNQEKYCEYFKECPLCEHFKTKAIEEFISLADAWCFNNFANCARHTIKKSGGMPASNMLPDGNLIRE
jgi:hypothetical protein